MRALVFLIFSLTSAACMAQSSYSDALTTLHKAPLETVLEPDVVVAKPPTIFKADGHAYLCYELLITNTESKPFHLERVNVYSGVRSFPVYEQGSAELKRSLKHPGWGERKGRVRDNQLIGGGERVVDLLWIELAPDTTPFGVLRHTATMRRLNAKSTITLPVAGDTGVESEAVTISPPLKGRNWAALNGPSATSQHRQSIDSYNGQTQFAERFATDWVQVDEKGRTAHGDRLTLKNFLCYGQPVYAVADATVSSVQESIPNGRPEAHGRPADPGVPMTFDTIAGNHVILDLGHGIYAAYAHLQPASIRVNVGDHVRTGDILGLVGNSGNSTEPHLHFQLMDANSVLGSQGLPFAFKTFTVHLGSHIVHDDLKPYALAEPVVHLNEIPVENEIVDFPE